MARRGVGGPDWGPAMRRVVSDPEAPDVVYQPIVDLQTGSVRGYEALARFPGPPDLSPAHWFAAADVMGIAARLEARVVTRVLRDRVDLPAGCFVTVNVSPHLLDSEPLAAAFAAGGDLTGLVVELTEHTQVADEAALATALAALRRAGATVAVDDAGSGWSGLHQVTLVRPEIVKIDRSLVARADRSDAKVALAELLGGLSTRMQSSLLAEGIERLEELAVFVRLGVPLGQGWLLGLPAAGWSTANPNLGRHIRSLAARPVLPTSVGALLDQVQAVEGSDSLWAQGAAVVVDEDGRAHTLLVPRTGNDAELPQQRRPVTLSVRASASLGATAEQAMDRPESHRFDPVVCTTDDGTYLGLVPVDRLMRRLAAAAPAPA